jgi:60 kDa SS-A/Ro ribonucleoprotein
MQSPVTGNRGSATSKVRCIDAAALIAAALLRKNTNGLVIPFDTSPHKADMNPRDSIMTNAQRLAAYGGGGTDCSVPIRAVLEPGNKIPLPDVAVFVSDNESWAGGNGRRGTMMMEAWHLVLAKKPKAKLICIDLAAYPTVQAVGAGVLNIGGFSDAVFDAMASFANGTLTDVDWVGSVKAVKLDAAAGYFAKENPSDPSLA